MILSLWQAPLLYTTPSFFRNLSAKGINLPIMGKEWHWSGRSSKRGGGAETEIPSGCMCAMFQAFDFHPFHFSINQQQSSIKSRTPEDHTVPKGTLVLSIYSSLLSKITTFLQVFFNLWLFIIQELKHQGVAWSQKLVLQCHQSQKRKILKYQ